MKYLSLTLPGGTEINGPPGVPTGGFTDGSTTGNILISNILQLSFAIAVIATLLVIVWGGFLWITSRGDKERLTAARNRIIYAIIGLILVFFSALIINLILFFLGQPTF